ncbi:hypothetical protein Harman_42050 [Haloarcula mannanilytica]|uniref:DUF7827 domain-containing protein n=1 Tax=Haloarcula mannanilytica TaxID=2509225 RepID=A0A4C2ERW4_9EURY|nr:BGTF surface domain-containing protein [Haloarcula mannanilytica]GCF16270.1 hypothetical protein Harman_42050 [Haloarcula mannanilytica]
MFLTALVVFSLFAGTVAFSGSAAAAANVSVEQAVEYSGSGGGEGTVELALNDSVTNGLDGNDELELYLDGTEVSDSLFDGVTQDGTNGRVEIALTRDVTPNRNLTVKLTDFAGGTLTATDIDVTSRTFTPGSGEQWNTDVYQGELIAIEDPDAGLDTDVHIDEKDGALLFEGSYIDNSQVFVFDTADLEPGQSYEAASGSDTAEFDVKNLRLDVEIDDANVTDKDSIVAEVTAVWGGLPAEATLLDNDDNEIDSIVKDLDGSEPVGFDFGSRSTDGSPYTVRITDNETGITNTSEEISVNESQEGEASLAENVVSEERGDVASITYSLSNTEDGYIVIGDKSEDNYAISGQITDDDGDGEVTVQFNSYLAGVPNSGNSSIAASDVLSAAGDDEISDVSESGAFKRSNLTVETLDATSYTMTVTAGTSRSSSPDSVGTLQLKERSTERMQSWVAPQDADLTATDIDIYDRIGTNLTQSDDIAAGDIVVHRITASGVEGPIEYRQDVKGAQDATAAFLQTAGDNGTFSLQIDRTNTGANAESAPLQLNSSNLAVVQDPDNNTYFIAVELANADYQSGTPVHDDSADEITSEFSVTDETGLTDGGDSIEDSYEITERDATLDTDGNIVAVQAAAEQSVSGTTTVAPGSEIKVQLKSDSDANPFMTQSTATVTPNKTFTASVGISDYATGTNFTASVLDVNGEQFGVSEDGQIVTVATTNDSNLSAGSDGTNPEIATEEPTRQATAERTEESTAVSTDSTTDRATEAATTVVSPVEPTEAGTTPASGPGFTMAGALIALVAAVLLTARCDP